MGLFYHAITPFMGLTYGTKGLVIFILGGTGSMLGAMVGGLLMGLVEAMTVGYVSSSLRDGVAFLVLLLVLLVRPTGLFGQVREAKV
jgi:branched-chain amino acid transport system permease protein